MEFPLSWVSCWSLGTPGDVCDCHDPTDCNCSSGYPCRAMPMMGVVQVLILCCLSACNCYRSSKFSMSMTVHHADKQAPVSFYVSLRVHVRVSHCTWCWGRVGGGSLLC